MLPVVVSIIGRKVRAYAVRRLQAINVDHLVGTSNVEKIVALTDTLDELMRLFVWAFQVLPGGVKE